MTFKTRHTTTWIDRSALQVRLRALSVPSDRNRFAARGVRRAATLAGAARERWWRRSGGWTGSVRTPEGGRSDRRAPIRAAHGRIIYIPGVAAVAGEAMDGGQWVDVRGVCPVFVHPERRWDTLLMSLIIVFGRHISGPPGSWAEVGLQGVPQTGKIIEVKKTTFEVFFFDTRGLGGFVWG